MDVSIIGARCFSRFPPRGVPVRINFIDNTCLAVAVESRLSGRERRNFLNFKSVDKGKRPEQNAFGPPRPSYILRVLFRDICSFVDRP